MTRRVIYDVGANDGDDIPYYLLKADVVVAIEANPELCEKIRSRFAVEIRSGRVAVEETVVVADPLVATVDFYLSKEDSGHSRVAPPPPEDADRFEKTTLPAQTIDSIVQRHGAPYYLKSDIEHYDHELLRSLFAAGIFPPYISAESHSLQVLGRLMDEGGYRAFKLVDGRTVSSFYEDQPIVCYPSGERTRHSFQRYSAGPFGDDVDGPWMSSTVMLRMLALLGLGWLDIHATREREPASRMVSLRHAAAQVARIRADRFSRRMHDHPRLRRLQNSFRG